jgi:hypothetical protein
MALPQVHKECECGDEPTGTQQDFHLADGQRHEPEKTEQENLQIIQLVRSMNMKPDEFAAFLRSGALNAAPTVTPYHKQEDAADET